MSRLPEIDPTTATGETRELLAGVHASLGMTPNMAKVMANSPALLKGWVGLNGALSGGVLPAALREQIALAVAEANGCDYCLSAHTALARGVAKLSDDEIDAARHATSTDPAADAALRLAATVNRTRGDVGDDEIAEARAAGLGDAEIAEVVGHVALNVLTNYFNKTAGVDIDFPVVTAHRHAH